MHAPLIALHAVAGFAALGWGCFAAWRRADLGPVVWSVGACIFFLAGAVAIDWSSLSTGSRLAYSAFVVLGIYMTWRAAKARLLWPPTTAQEAHRATEHLGFTIVALLVGFLVIAILDLGAPGWLAASVGLGGAVAGHRGVATVKGHIGSQVP
jgi:hypothetical protein